MFFEAALEKTIAWTKRAIQNKITKHIKNELINKAIWDIDRQHGKIDNASIENKCLIVNKNK